MARPAGMMALRNAAENAGGVPITDAEIAAILRGDGGFGPHVRAIFGDASLATLANAGRICGIDLPVILQAYLKAKAEHAAANRELDAAAASA